MSNLTLEQKFLIESLRKSLNDIPRDELEDALIKAYTSALEAQNTTKELLLEKINITS